MERGGASSAKGREVMARVMRDEQYRAAVIANLREGREGPDYTFDELSPAEREFLQSGRWRTMSTQRMQAAAETAEFTWQ